MKMHLRTQDDVMTQDQNQVSTTNIPNKIQLPHNNSNKSLLSEKEPRQVYISLRESKLSGSASSGHTYDNNSIDERLRIMPVLNDNLMGDGIEYVTLDECRLIADESLVAEQTNYNVENITGVSEVQHSMHNTPGVKVLVQPLFVQQENQHVNEFTMSMQTSQHPQNNTNNNPNVVVQNGGTNMLPITNFNPSLPTEPLPYEETLNMQKSDMEVSSPHGKETLDASEGSSNGSGRNFAYLDNSDPSVLQYNQIQTSLYPSNDLCEIDKISSGRFHTPSQLQPTKDNFEQIKVSPNGAVNQGISPQSSTSPTYSLSESPYIHISAANNDQQPMATNFGSNGPISPSESSSSFGSQESSISSTSKRHQMFMEDKRTRQYSESCILSNAEVSSTRARHQSDGNVNIRSRTKKLQASRRSVDANKNATSTKNLAGKRRSKHPMPEDSKDEKYWRRRAKNNEAAKKSREAKRQKEDEVLHKVEHLESENSMLRRKLEEAKSEIRVLKAQLDKN